MKHNLLLYLSDEYAIINNSLGEYYLDYALF